MAKMKSEIIEGVCYYYWLILKFQFSKKLVKLRGQSPFDEFFENKKYLYYLKLSCKFLDAGSIFLYNFQNPELYIKKTRPYTTFKKEVVGHSGNIRWIFFWFFKKEILFEVCINKANLGSFKINVMHFLPKKKIWFPQELSTILKKIFFFHFYKKAVCTIYIYIYFFNFQLFVVKWTDDEDIFFEPFTYLDTSSPGTFWAPTKQHPKNLQKYHAIFEKKET